MDKKEIDITDGIRQFYVPRLNMVSSTVGYGMRNWLGSTDAFIPDNFTSERSFELSFYDISSFLSSLASDISRLSCASIESLNSISMAAEAKKFLAWELIKYYYSAFFAAHSTLKACGFGLVQLDRIILENIRQRANTLGMTSPTLQKGIYCFKVDPNNSKVSFFLVSKYNDSHKGLWHRYMDFLDIITGLSIETYELGSNCIKKNDLAVKPSKCIYSQMSLADAETVASRLEELKHTLNRQGDSNWLSYIRNRVNYNHSFGVWFPYRSFDEKHLQIPELKDLFMLSPLCNQFAQDSSNELVSFVKCCQLVNSINYSIINDLAHRHPDNKSFLQQGPFSYINRFKR